MFLIISLFPLLLFIVLIGYSKFLGMVMLFLITFENHVNMPIYMCFAVSVLRNINMRYRHTKHGLVNQSCSRVHRQLI